jgi:uncharacterized membrane protein HdeD (DUF308 family)
MVESMTRYWWAVALRGVFAVVFGLFALIWPHITLLALVILFGAYVFADGLLRLVSAILGPRPGAGAGRGTSRGWLVVGGLAGLVVGVLTFLWPGTTVLVLLWLIAIWALVTGVMEIAAAFRLRGRVSGVWAFGLGGVLSVIFGILLLAWPATGALALIVLIGVYALVFGLVVIGLGLRLRRLGQQPRMPGPARPASA